MNTSREVFAPSRVLYGVDSRQLFSLDIGKPTLDKSSRATAAKLLDFARRGVAELRHDPVFDGLVLVDSTAHYPLDFDDRAGNGFSFGTAAPLLDFARRGVAELRHDPVFDGLVFFVENTQGFVGGGVNEFDFQCAPSDPACLRSPRTFTPSTSIHPTRQTSLSCSCPPRACTPSCCAWHPRLERPLDRGLGGGI